MDDETLIFVTKESLEELFTNRFQTNDTIRWISVDWRRLEKDLDFKVSINLSDYFTSAPRLSSFYAINSATIKFNPKTYKVGEIDSLLIQPEYRYTNILNCCYFGNLDSIKLDSVYREKNKKVGDNIKIEIQTQKKGFNKIEGMYELPKLDGSIDLIPFTYEYEVK